MTRISCVSGDLLFGSRITELLREGNEVTLGPAPDAAAEIAVIDLAGDPEGGMRALKAAVAAGTPTLVAYAHVEPDVRDRALTAGADLVVPRSRLVREGAALVAQVLARR